ncbi:OmpA family protein [Pedobacter ginsengisoli]|uniref:OmpA family protein n=1 Tax=Pedobacter ginsengisoli TaxID=363852 RepID=UPI00254D8173|nr:OmpA family protein [Pedobacter ginsengisoli]
MKPKITKLLLIAALSFSSFCVQAQFLKKLAKATAQRAVEKGVNKIADKAVDKGVDKVFEEKQDKDTSAAEGAAPAGKPSISTYSKFDFVPGEQILYAEDFNAENVGELPASWNSNANGVVVATTEPAGKWVQLNQGIYLAGAKIPGFGKDFTIEFDVLLNATSKSGYYLPAIYFGALASGAEEATANKFLKEPHVNNAFEFKIEPKEPQSSKITLKSFQSGRETFSSDRKQMPFFDNTLRAVAHYAVAVQGSRLRMWINENKVLDVPKAVNVNVPINQLYFKGENSGGYNESNYSYLISNLKVASGYPDTRSKLVTEGKLVTTGILFDVNSADIKAQSYGVLKEIAQTLNDNPEMKISITGHTDADGNAASNLQLSKRRAASVKDLLASQFAVKADRMVTDGKGAAQPVADNKTVTGKAANRRVEFVKL